MDIMVILGGSACETVNGRHDPVIVLPLGFLDFQFLISESRINVVACDSDGEVDFSFINYIWWVFFQE